MGLSQFAFVFDNENEKNNFIDYRKRTEEEEKGKIFIEFCYWRNHWLIEEFFLNGYETVGKVSVYIEDINKLENLVNENFSLADPEDYIKGYKRIDKTFIYISKILLKENKLLLYESG